MLAYLTYLEQRGLYQEAEEETASGAAVKWFYLFGASPIIKRGTTAEGGIPQSLLLLLRRWLHPVGIELLGVQLEHFIHSLYLHAAQQGGGDDDVKTAAAAAAASAAPAASGLLQAVDGAEAAEAPHLPAPPIQRRPTVWSSMRGYMDLAAATNRGVLGSAASGLSGPSAVAFLSSSYESYFTEGSSRRRSATSSGSPLATAAHSPRGLDLLENSSRSAVHPVSQLLRLPAGDRVPHRTIQEVVSRIHHLHEYELYRLVEPHTLSPIRHHHGRRRLERANHRHRPRGCSAHGRWVRLAVLCALALATRSCSPHLWPPIQCVHRLCCLWLLLNLYYPLLMVPRIPTSYIALNWAVHLVLIRGVYLHREHRLIYVLLIGAFHGVSPRWSVLSGNEQTSLMWSAMLFGELLGHAYELLKRRLYFNHRRDLASRKHQAAGMVLHSSLPNRPSVQQSNSPAIIPFPPKRTTIRFDASVKAGVPIPQQQQNPPDLRSVPRG